MKFNKVIMGLGVMGLLFTSCDGGRDQEYTPAPGVTAPPAYFSLDYSPEIVLEEGQTEFSVPVFRANTAGEQTISVNVTTSSNVTGNFNIPSKVTFADGAGQADMVVTYDWDFMKANPGVDFEFKFDVPGEPSPYYITEVSYTAVYVPWENIVGPQGGTTSYFLDDLFWSGWNGPETQKFEVVVQHIVGLEKYKDIFRILTPYANCPHIGGDGQGIYEGPSTGNDMYLNAQDHDNVFLCDKSGKPITTYNTYYVMDETYGQVHYWDCVSAYQLDEVLSNNGKSYPNSNSKGDTSVNGVYDADNMRITFPVGHFYVYVPETAFTTDGNELTILLPDGKEVKNWEEVGLGMYTDGFISFLNEYGEDITYEVPIEQSTKDPNIYRLVNPYTNYWPDGNEQDEDYCIEIDCTDTQLVTIKYQDTGATVYYKRKDLPTDILNAGYFFQNQVLQEQELLSPEEIIAQGLNDTFEDGVINIAHPIGFLWTDESKQNLYVVFPYEDGSTGCKFVFPSADTQKVSYANKASRNSGKFVSHKNKPAGEKLVRKYSSAATLPFAKVIR